MSAQRLESLLEVQEHDTALDRLRHRRAALSERAELESVARAWRATEGARDEVKARRDKIHAEERRLDDESRALGDRAAEVDKRLYSGSTTSLKELQAMQADIEMLKRQRSELEDEELEVMEQREALDAELAGFDAQIATMRASAERLQDAIAAAEAEIDAEIAQETAARDALAGPLDESLVRDYERRRAQNKGAGAARLVGTTCQACHLTIPSTEAERIRREAGSVVSYCDNCGAILVP
jgi:predicted  nucleic acid-binding Zn-ribbon protein